MTPPLVVQLRKQFAGWFQTSFWVDVHYALAALGALVVFGVYVLAHRFDAGIAGFDAAMWTTAIANDKLNMPPVGP